MPFSIFPWGGGSLPWNQSDFRRPKLKKFPDSPDSQFLGQGVDMHQTFSMPETGSHWQFPGYYFFCSSWKIRRCVDLFIYLQIVCVQYLAELWETRVTSFLWFLENGVDMTPRWAKPRTCVLFTPLFALERTGLPSLEQWSPTFLEPGTSFVEDSFSMDQSQRDGFEIIQAQYLYCVLFFLLLLHQIHLRSLGIN